MRWQNACFTVGMQLGTINCRTTFSGFGVVLCSLLVLLFQPHLLANESVTLAWNPSTSPDVAGYIIYYGTASHVYSSAQLVFGNTTRVTLFGLVPGTTYYFSATTLDIFGNQSGLSNEARYTVPVTPAALTLATRASGRFGFKVSGDAGRRYVVQASTNLLDWISLQTNVAPFQFTDLNAGSFHQRFYRAFYLPP
jgi:Fibronectin type III domain